MAVIEVAGLGRRYELGPTTVTALADVDLTVEAGEFVVVLGPSGSGKTTLLNLIGALDVPTDGTPEHRRDVPAGRHAGRAVPVPAPDRSASCSRPSTCSRRSRRGRTCSSPSTSPRTTGPTGPGADEVLERVGLGDRTGHFPHQLSGGEQQRVAIARALATGNPVLLADEPTGELDFRTGVQILELLREQAHSGVTVLVVTHNREIAKVADRVIELSSGRIVGDAAPAGGPTPVSDLRW